VRLIGPNVDPPVWDCPAFGATTISMQITPLARPIRSGRAGGDTPNTRENARPRRAILHASCVLHNPIHSDLRPLPYLILVLDSDGPQGFPEVCLFLASKSILHTALNDPSNYRTSIEGSVGGSPSNSSTDAPDVMPGSS